MSEPSGARETAATGTSGRPIVRATSEQLRHRPVIRRLGTRQIRQMPGPVTGMATHMVASPRFLPDGDIHFRILESRRSARGLPPV